jgi:putative phage-type endonuclease
MSDRMGFIGGSDISAIIGLSPWKTPYALWEEKVYGVTDEITPERQAIFDWGKRLEPYVIDELEAKHDIQVVHRNRIMTALPEEFGFPARAEIDFEFFDGDDLANGDVKTASVYGKDGWGESGSDEVPTYYTAQFQWGMGMTGANVCLCAVLFGANDLRLYRIKRDDAIIAYLREAAVRFWNSYVLPMVPPPLANSTDAEKRMAKFNGVTLTASPELHEKIKRLHGVKQAIKRLETMETTLGDTVKIALADGLTVGGMQNVDENSAIVDDAGRPLVTWNPQTAKRVSVTKLKVDYPEIAEAVTETSTFRVMRLKERNL